MRVDVNLTDVERDRVKAYSERAGVRMPRAYAELIRKGLDAEGDHA